MNDYYPEDARISAADAPAAESSSAAPTNGFYPEGARIAAPENRAAMKSAASLRDAAARGAVLESRVVKCDPSHALHVDLGVMRGVIPREEGAIGIDTGLTRDIALISRVGKPVCFVITGFSRAPDGRLCAVCSRKRAQEMCARQYLSRLIPGDVIGAKVTHLENFGAFCDVGAGVSALLPIDAISVSRIPHPCARFVPGQDIRAVVRERDAFGRLTLTHKELLGTWEENVSRFSVGETVPGVVRSVENYGVFIELTPNLAGLAEYTDRVQPGQYAAVYIKNIIPERMKVKLVIVDVSLDKPPYRPLHYFFKGDHISAFSYAPAGCGRRIETVFDS